MTDLPKVDSSNPAEYHKAMWRHHADKRDGIRQAMLKDPKFAAAHKKMVDTPMTNREESDKAYNDFKAAESSHPMYSLYKHHHEEALHHYSKMQS